MLFCSSILYLVCIIYFCWIILIIFLTIINVLNKLSIQRGRIWFEVVTTYEASCNYVVMWYNATQKNDFFTLIKTDIMFNFIIMSGSSTIIDLWENRACQTNISKSRKKDKRFIKLFKKYSLPYYLLRITPIQCLKRQKWILTYIPVCVRLWTIQVW